MTVPEMGESKASLEEFYAKEDPWDYQKTPDDIARRRWIVHTSNYYGPFRRALDVGAGEGWITSALPAGSKFGYELSDAAASRFPTSVQRLSSHASGPPFDLVVCTGALYAHYDWRTLATVIKTNASDYILTCHIEAWELAQAIAEIPGKQVFEARFPYRSWHQKLRVFKL